MKGKAAENILLILRAWTMGSQALGSNRARNLRLRSTPCRRRDWGWGTEHVPGKTEFQALQQHDLLPAGPATSMNFCRIVMTTASCNRKAPHLRPYDHQQITCLPRPRAMVVQSNILEIPLQAVPISFDFKLQIASRFWDQGIDPHETSALDPYFRYYTAQSDLALHDLGRYASVQTHREITRVTDMLKEGLPRDGVKRRLGPQTDEEMENDDDDDDGRIQGSIDLAGRLLLMLRIGPIHYGFSGHK